MQCMTQAPSGTRERLIGAMREALGTRGYHGVGLTELLSAANAPKGVLYHHFPLGKAELAVAAIDAVVGQLEADLERIVGRSQDLSQALATWMSGAQKMLHKSGFEAGCPLATIALESTAADDAIRLALARGFASIRQRLCRALCDAGVAKAKAINLAALIVSAYEGALLQARVAGDVQAMQDTTQALIDLLRHHIGPDTT